VGNGVGVGVLAVAVPDVAIGVGAETLAACPPSSDVAHVDCARLIAARS